MKQGRRWIFLFLVLALAITLGVYGWKRDLFGRQPKHASLKHPAVEDSRSTQQIQDDFDAFMQQLFVEEVTADTLTLNYTLVHPENYGIDQVKPTLGAYSLSNFQSEQLINENHLASLEQFDYGSLTEEQQLEYDILHSILETDLSSADLLEYMECLGPTTGIQAQLPLILAEYHFYEKENIEDYLVLLQQLPDYFDQIMDFEEMKSEKGLFMGDAACRAIIEQCKDFIAEPEENYLISAFDRGISEVKSLTDEEKSSYQEKNKQAISEKVIPAYQDMADRLTSLLGTGNNKGGTCKLAKGKEYYEYLIKAIVGSDRSMREIRKLLDASLKKAQKRMSQIMTDTPDVFYDADEVDYPCTDPVETVQYLKEHIDEDFEKLPDDITCQVKYVDDSMEDALSPALYLSSPIDDYKRNVVYLNQSEDYELEDAFSTIAHESYPGHLYQNAYFLSTSPAPIRCIVSIGGYEEGWGTYAEKYGYELAGLDDHVADLLGQNLIATLCLYAKADIEVNYYGWPLKRLISYLKEFGFDAGQAKMVYESVVAEPVSYMQYTLGYLEIEDLKQTAQDQLGDQFSKKEFHKFYLGTGPAPFVVLRDRLEDWIKSQRQ